MKDLSFSLSWLLAGVVSILVLLLALAPQQKVGASGEFVTTWKTDISDPLDATLTIPTYGGDTYDYMIDWGDGSSDTNVTGDSTHTYAAPGTYTVTISGDFPRLYFNGYSDAHKIMSVESWGDIVWSSMTDAFEGASNLVINATDAPDLSSADSLSGMFIDASSMNQPIGHWDISTITNVSYMFHGATTFNQDLSAWDVTNVQTHLGMFYNAQAFNQDISSWNMARTNSMNSMFRGASSFNQPVNTWNTSNVSDTRFMFLGASAFNQPVSNWRLPLVQRMDSMFNGATAFDQDVGDWDVDNLQRADFMFNNSGLSSANYDALLLGWQNNDLNPNGVFFAQGVTYCNGLNAHEYLVSTLGWFMFDDGFDTSTCGPSDVSFLDNPNLVLPENEDETTLIGTLSSVDVDSNSVHTYGFTCTDQYPDTSFFSLNSNQLFTNTSFNYDDPQDADQNNIYVLCIRSEDEHGNSVDKEILVEITDVEEVVVDEGEVLGVSTTTDNSDSEDNTANVAEPQVLAATENSDVLANTGLGSLNYIFIGFFVTTTALVSVAYKRKIYSIY